MSTDADSPVGSARPEPSPDLLRDLAEILSGDMSINFHIEPEGAVLVIRSPRTRAFGESQGRWVRMTRETRARWVLDWIRRAAAYHRNPRTCQPIPRDEAVA